MSIRWIRNVMIDGEKSTLEVQLGSKSIGDKCYTRIGTDNESYFSNMGDNRDDILAQGVDILMQRLDGHKVKYPNGQDYDWQ